MILMEAGRDLSAPDGDAADLVDASIALHYQEIALGQQCTNALGLRDADFGNVVEAKLVSINVRDSKVRKGDGQVCLRGVLRNPTAHITQIADGSPAPVRQSDAPSLSHAASTSFNSRSSGSSSFPNTWFARPRPPSCTKGTSSKSSMPISRDVATWSRIISSQRICCAVNWRP